MKYFLYILVVLILVATGIGLYFLFSKIKKYEECNEQGIKQNNVCQCYEKEIIGNNCNELEIGNWKIYLS